VAVVVTHGGTAGRLMERLLGLGPDHRRILGPLANCAWSELTVQAGHWRLVRHNSGVPLPAEGHGAAVPPGAAGPRDAGASPEEGAPADIGDADAVL
jgi:probable phosphoglycerate mutase